MGFFKANKMIDAYSKLEIGMPKERVIELLGSPDGRKVLDESTEVMKWANTEFKGLLRGGNMERKIEVTFKDGKVSGYDGDNMSASAW